MWYEKENTKIILGKVTNPVSVNLGLVCVRSRDRWEHSCISPHSPSIRTLQASSWPERGAASQYPTPTSCGYEQMHIYCGESSRKARNLTTLAKHPYFWTLGDTDKNKSETENITKTVRAQFLDQTIKFKLWVKYSFLRSWPLPLPSLLSNHFPLRMH